MVAESVGLEICYIGSILNNWVEVIELLGGNNKPRLPLHSVLHWETFDCASADDGLRTYAAAVIAAGIYKARHVPVPYKPEEMELRLDGAL